MGKLLIPRKPRAPNWSTCDVYHRAYGDTLRNQLSEAFPDCYDRCQKRRKFMTDVLGIELPEEILPLSNVPGIVPPFFLAPNEVFVLES